MNKVESRELRVECQKAGVALRAGSDHQHSTLNTQHPRRGVTLIELLIVILIISILAALVLGVAAVAGETARQAQTKHTVERLHTLLTDFYDTFKTRRVRLNPKVEQVINNDNSKNAAQKRQALAEARLYALREIMLMEIPDRWSDLLLTAVPDSGYATVQPKYPVYLDSTTASAASTYGRTPLAAAYLRRYFRAAASAPSADILKENQGAELLYLIITMACGDGEARSQFKEADIGDTDGDGAPEFLDGWGHPINFLRWAPGFDSQIELDANSLQTTDQTLSTYWKTAAAKDHDPFDVYRIDPFSYRLVPLIYSGGRDETFGIRLVKGYVAWEGLANLNAAVPNPLPKLTPYQKVTDLNENPVPPPEFLGTPNVDGTATDNIHNHLLGLR